jgi:hypothetical protein
VGVVAVVWGVEVVREEEETVRGEKGRDEGKGDDITIHQITFHNTPIT